MPSHALSQEFLTPVLLNLLGGRIRPPRPPGLLLVYNSLLPQVGVQRRYRSGSPYAPGRRLKSLLVRLPRQHDVLNLILQLQASRDRLAGDSAHLGRLLRRRNRHDRLLGNHGLVKGIHLVDLMRHQPGIKQALVVLDNLETHALLGVTAVNGRAELLGELPEANLVEGDLVAGGKGLEHLAVHGFGCGCNLAPAGFPFRPRRPVGHRLELEVED